MATTVVGTIIGISQRVRARTDSAMTTAEYAVGIMAAVAFAAALIAVMRSPAVRAALSRIVQSALGTAG